MANDKQRMVTMPDGKQYPLMPQPTPNPHADRAAAQEVVAQQQQPVANTVANPDVQAFAQGKAAANTTPNLFRTPVTEPEIRAAMSRPAVIQRSTTSQQQQSTGNGSKGFVAPQNDKQNKPITSMEELARAMGYTDPREEERMRKASLMNQRILAVGDALRHIGNIANTVNYAPAQQFNSPVAEEQARYEKGKAMRDRANQQYIAYQQAKAKQDAEQKRWEQQFGLQKENAEALNAYRKEQARIAEQKAANEKEYRAADLARKTKADEDAAKHRNRMAGIAGMNAQTGRMRANAYIKYLQEKGAGGKGGSQYDFATPNGTITMPKNFNQTQKDQVLAKFDKYIDRSEMQKQMMALGLNTQDPAQVRNFQFAKMLQEHQDVADYVSEKFRGKQAFTNNPLARPGETSSQQPLFQTAWSQQNNAPAIGWDDDDEDVHNNDDENLIGW